MRGARLVLPTRSLKTADEVKARIVAEIPDAEVILLPLDLSSLSSVRCFVSRFLALHLPLNLLINNAGRMVYEHAVSEDGVEMTFATNFLGVRLTNPPPPTTNHLLMGRHYSYFLFLEHSILLGHFLLTKLLLNKMAETAREMGIQGRIVNVSSHVHSWFSGDCLSYLDRITRKQIPYDATRAYALSKLANILHTKELAERLKVCVAMTDKPLSITSVLLSWRLSQKPLFYSQQMGANVTANCVHPGVVRTRLNRDREGFVTGPPPSPIPRPCGRDDVLRGDTPAAGRGLREVLRRLQRGLAVSVGFQAARGGAAVARLRVYDGHRSRPDPVGARTAARIGPAGRGEVTTGNLFTYVT
ncbi:hypothetical protein BHE74_00044019 [Ensete ventricosum]|nr:hypothetical protein BHE74_00044019 [Ensete ventricosum]